MKVGVCIKRVPSSDTRINVSDPSTGVSLADVSWELNPYDMFAVEAALQLRESGIASDVVLFTVGGAEVETKVRDALAMGTRGKDVSKAVRLDDPGFSGSDTLGIARILAAACTHEGVGLVLTGKQAIDGDSAQVPGMMGELLGWPSVSSVSKMEIEGETVKAWRPAGGGMKEIVELPLPCVVTCDKGMNSPRRPTLPGIMMAKKKPIEVLDAAAIGLDTAMVGAGAALTTESQWGPPADRPEGRILEGEGVEVVKELVRLLRDEAKVI